MIEIVRRQGPRLMLITKPGDGEDATVVNPGTATDPTFDALIAEIQRRLDVDRGYRTSCLSTLEARAMVSGTAELSPPPWGRTRSCR